MHLLHSDLTEATLAGATISLVAAIAIVVLLTAVSVPTFHMGDIRQAHAMHVASRAVAHRVSRRAMCEQPACAELGWGLW